MRRKKPGMIAIALGANLPSSAGGPADTLRAALSLLARRGVTVERLSGFYVSAAWPDPSDPVYVNAVAEIHTVLAPSALLQLLHAVEAAFGRERGKPNAPRTLDLDLLDYESLIQPGPPELPHPRMAERLFVLLPLRDIAPDWRHPVTGASVASLIAAALPMDIHPLAGPA
jgi:2-amino-4-hydroxy-6-hydroxymethyldihydropteridine diphosphokinase